MCDIKITITILTNYLNINNSNKNQRVRVTPGIRN